MKICMRLVVLLSFLKCIMDTKLLAVGGLERSHNMAAFMRHVRVSAGIFQRSNKIQVSNLRKVFPTLQVCLHFILSYILVIRLISPYDRV